MAKKNQSDNIRYLAYASIFSMSQKKKSIDGDEMFLGIFMYTKEKKFFEYCFQDGIQLGNSNLMYLSINFIEQVISEFKESGYKTDLTDEFTQMLHSLEAILDKDTFQFIENNIIRGMYQFGVLQIHKSVETNQLPKVIDDALLSYVDTKHKIALCMTLITHNDERITCIISSVKRESDEHNLIVYGASLSYLIKMESYGAIADMLDCLLEQDISFLDMKEYVVPNEEELANVTQFIKDRQWAFRRTEIIRDANQQLSLFEQT